MLLGREAELGRLDRVLAELADGRGGALFVRGEAGIGKSALLAALAERAHRRGMGTLTTRGVESESELAFSGLADLALPLEAELGRLPEPQAAALAGALALGPPRPGERLAVSAALRRLLDDASREQPLVVIVDDLNWLDGPSRECVMYAARRTGAGFSVVMSAREGEYDPAEVRDLPDIAPAPLDRPSALALLGRGSPGLAPGVAAAVADAARGVPLALLELPTMLGARERAGESPLSEPLDLSPRLADIYTARIAGLSHDARRALTIAAAYEGDDLRVVGAACAQAGLPADVLSEGERARLATASGGRLSFAHPTARAAVYQQAEPADRRAAHRAVAAVVDAERGAWHLGLAAVGPDEEVAQALEDAGVSALARRGPGPASLALERAARLSTCPERCARRLLGAGEAAAAAGQHRRAEGLLDEAIATTADAATRSDAVHARAQALTWSGAVGEAVELLEDESRSVAADAPERAGRMLADAALASSGTGDIHRSLDLSARALSLIEGRGCPEDPAALVAHGWSMALRGEGRAAAPFLRRAAARVGEVDPLAHGAQWHNVLMRARLASGHFGEVYRESDALCARAHDRGAVGALPGTLVVFADAAYRLGEWGRCEDACREAMATAADTGQHLWKGYALVVLARVEAALGREEASRAAALGALGVAQTVGIPAGLRYAHAVLGFLDLGLGHMEAAASSFSNVEEVVRRSGIEELVVVPWAPDAIEAYVATDRRDAAERVLTALAGQAARTGSPFLEAVLGRARGIAEDDFDEHFRAALATEGADGCPFEEARTLLAYGRRLHRARRRIEARARLEAAQAIFSRLGAAPWSEQARAELRAAGARGRTRRGDGLTDQEERVAQAAAGGSTNREIAQDLYLSPKTIEFHLGNIYRKLHLRSRTELAALFADESRPPASAAVSRE